MAGIGQHTVAELAQAFVGGDITLSDQEMGLLDAWEQLTLDVTSNKFDLLLSSAYDSTTFSGLNASLTDKYLSDDLSLAVDLIPDFFARGGFGRFGRFFESGADWAAYEGYGFFDYADFEGLVLQDEHFEDEELREEFTSRRRRGSMFARRHPATKGAPRRAARPQRARRTADRRAARPGAPRADVDMPLEAALVELPTADEVREDPTWVSAYPPSMGRAGATMLTRPQRGLAKMLSASRPKSRTAAIERTAQRLVSNQQLTGPSAGRPAVAGTSPRFGALPGAPMAFDAFAAEDMPLLAGIPWTSEQAAEQATVAAGWSAPGAATAVMLDDLFVSREQLPALTGAIEVAQAAFGAEAPAAGGFVGSQRAPQRRLGGVFSAARMDDALKVVTIAGDRAATAPGGGREPQVGYREMIYDAAEHTWVLPEPTDFADFDAAEGTASVRRAGKSVAPKTATAQLIAQSLTAASKAAVSGAAQAAQAATAWPTSAQVAAQTAPFSQVGPVVAPIAGLQGVEPAELAREVARFATPAPAPRATATPSVTLETLVPAAARSPFSTRAARQGAATAIAAGATRVAAGQADFASPEVAAAAAQAAGPAGAWPRSAMTAPPFTGAVARGHGARMGVTSTGPEMFAARHLDEASTLGGMLHAMDAPATVAGEVRYGYGSLGGPMDDPTLYVQLQSELGEAGPQSWLRSDPTPTVSAARKMSPAVAATLDAVSMPLSSAHKLATVLGAMATRRQMDAATTISLATPESAPAAPIGATRWPASAPVAMRRTTDSIGPITTTTAAEGFWPAATALAESAATPAAAAALQASPAEGDPLFYQYSFDAETAFIKPDAHSSSPASAVAGQHVEVRDGKVVRAVPATAAAQRAGSARPAPWKSGAPALGAAITPMLGGLGSGGPAQRAAARFDELRKEGIEPAKITPVVTGASALESGFPALSIAGGTARVDAPWTTPKATGVVAASAEADLAMLPPMVREMVARQTRASLEMTAGGAGTAALLERLAAVADPTSPGARTAVLHQLAALGVDTPELLKILDETSPGSAIDTSVATGLEASALLKRDGAARTSLFGEHVSPTAQASELMRTASAVGPERGIETSRRLEQIVERLTGNPALAAPELSVEQDSYWGDFAPAKLAQGSAADMLKALLGGRTPSAAQRASALAFGAEMGELVAMESAMAGADRAGSSTIARSVAKATRASATGAPTRAVRLSRAEKAAKRAEKRSSVATLADRTGTMADGIAERSAPMRTPGRPSAVSTTSGWDGQDMPLTQIDAEQALADRTAAEPGQADEVETFVDQVAGAIAASITGGGVAEAAGASAFGWDREALPLAAITEQAEPGLADRVAGASTPWAKRDITAGRITAAERTALKTEVRRSAGQAWPSSSGPGEIATQHPLVSALRDSDLDRPADGPGRMDRGPIGRSMGPLGETLVSDGARGFESIGATALESVLSSLPTRRQVTQFLGGGLDLAYAVIDRANGSFAGLDAGVLRYLAAAEARNESAGEREIFPGLDEWPAETLEMLHSAGWGDGPSGQPSTPSTSVQGAESRVQRLERRIEAAKEAYGRMSDSRSRGGRAPTSVDSVDWSLVDTGAARNAPQTADLGRLANTMVRPTSAPETDMAMIAPAVKVVAQQAQLKPKREGVGSAGAGKQHTKGPQGRALGQKKRVNYEALAGQIARRLSRRWALERDRHGKSS